MDTETEMDWQTEEKESESEGSRWAHAARITDCILCLSVYLCECVCILCVHTEDKKCIKTYKQWSWEVRGTAFTAVY